MARGTARAHDAVQQYLDCDTSLACVERATFHDFSVAQPLSAVTYGWVTDDRTIMASTADDARLRPVHDDAFKWVAYHPSLAIMRDFANLRLSKIACRLTPVDRGRRTRVSYLPYVIPAYPWCASTALRTALDVVKSHELILPRPTASTGSSTLDDDEVARIDALREAIAEHESKGDFDEARAFRMELDQIIYDHLDNKVLSTVLRD